MKKNVHTLLKTLFLLAAVSFVVASCNEKKTKTETESEDIEGVADSTVYGICDENTTMSCVEIVTSEGDTLRYTVENECDSCENPVKGGLLAGDKIAVIGYKTSDGELIAQKVININTLHGKWSSIDKNFEIKEGGLVESAGNERSRYVKWQILNGNLILAPDTFQIYSLGPDSLLLENRDGIYAFSRLN